MFRPWQGSLRIRTSDAPESGPQKDMGSPGPPWERSKAPGKSSWGRLSGLVYSDEQWGAREWSRQPLGAALSGSADPGLTLHHSSQS